MTAPSGNLNYFRRSLAALAVWLLCVLAVFGFTSRDAASEEAFNPGTGNAIARLVRVDPKQGGLSFGVTSGLALAGHQNTVAQADSRSVDLGVIGTVLGSEASCDGSDGSATLPADKQPQPVIVRSDDGTSGPQTSEEIPGIKQSAVASKQPFAEAKTTMAPFGVDGVIEFGSSVATSTSGVVAAGVREARSVVEYSKLEILNGAVTLNGLRWEAVHRSGAQQVTEGSFTVDGLTQLGVPVPIGDGAQAVNTANDVLRLVGFELMAPEVRVVEGVVFVDPLRIGIIPSEIRDTTLTGPLLGGLQPVREQLFDALLAMDCGNSTYITVADLGIGVVSASGEFGLEIGGVQTKTTDIDFFEFGSGGLLTPPPPATPAEPVDTGSTDTGSDSAGSDIDTDTSIPDEPDTAPTTDAAPSTEQALPISNKFVGKRGGVMALVAGGGLLLLGAMAEGDRRKMLRAQREIPMEMA